MNLLSDKSVDRKVVDKLRQDGHNVVYVSEMDQAFRTMWSWPEGHCLTRAKVPASRREDSKDDQGKRAISRRCW